MGKHKNKTKKEGKNKENLFSVLKPVCLKNGNGNGNNNSVKKEEKLEDEIGKEIELENFQDFVGFNLGKGFSHLVPSLQQDNSQQTTQGAREENIENVAEREGTARGRDNVANQNVAYENIRYDVGYQGVSDGEAERRGTEEVIRVSKIRREQFRVEIPEMRREIDTGAFTKKMMDTSMGRFGSEDEMYTRAPAKKDYEVGLPFENENKKRRKF